MNRLQSRRAALRLLRHMSTGRRADAAGPADPAPPTPPRFRLPGRDTATRLAWPLLVVPVQKYKQCRSAVNAMPESLGVRRLCQRELDVMVHVNYNHIEMLTRAVAQSLSWDPVVARASGVSPAFLLLLVDQRVAIGRLATTLDAMRVGATQQVAIFDAAERELTDQLYVYYDHQRLLGKLSPSEEQSLHEDFAELVALRRQKQKEIRKIKKANAKWRKEAQEAVEEAMRQS